MVAIGPPRDASGDTWPTVNPRVAPEKRPSVMQRHRVSKAGADDGRRHAEHFAHAWPAVRPLVADDDDVAGLDGLMLNGVERGLLAVEHPRRTAMQCAFRPRELEHAAFRSQIARQDDEAAVRLERMVDRTHHFLSGCLDRLGGLLRERVASDRWQRPR